MTIRRALTTSAQAGLAVLVVLAIVWFFMKPTATVEPPAPPARPAAVKKAVVKAAPTQPTPVTVNVYPPPAPAPTPDVTINVYPPAPPAAVPAPAPAPAPTSVYPQPMPPPTVVVERPVIVRQPSSLSFNFNIFASGVPWNGGGYGPSYGWNTGPTRWVPGYQRWVCEGPPPPAGPGCYYKWEPAHYE